jgi:hypothetical protein
MHAPNQSILADRRIDARQAAVVEAGRMLALRRGMAAAVRYLGMHNVAPAICARVLTDKRLCRAPTQAQAPAAPALADSP